MSTRTSCHPFGFLPCPLSCTPYLKCRRQRDLCCSVRNHFLGWLSGKRVRISAVLLSVRNRYHIPRQALRPRYLQIPHYSDLHRIACCQSENIDLIQPHHLSRLNHFTCVPSLYVPVPRLNLTLPLRFQELGTDDWSGSIRWDSPLNYINFPMSTIADFNLQGKISYADFSAHTAYCLYN